MTKRREAIRKLALVGAAMSFPGAAVTFANTLGKGVECTRDKFLSAFIDTVVPGAPVHHPDITAAFRDRFYGFNKYLWLFSFDLRARSQRLFGIERFDHLGRHQRELVVRNALRSPGKMRQLYSGAIQLAQVTVYTGFYCEPEQCELIDFRPEFEFCPTTYTNSKEFFGHSMTTNGQLP